MRGSGVKFWLLGGVLLAWGVQVLWLGWHFAPEAGDAAMRLVQGRGGEAVRQEDPYYRWLLELKKVIPPRAAYLFLDRYETGKDIAARYHLYPRQHKLVSPRLPASFLYFNLRRYQASDQPLEPSTRAALSLPVFRLIKVPGPGLVFEVDPAALHGDFYD